MTTLKLSTNLIELDGLFCTYWGYGKSEYTLNEDMIEQDFEDGCTDVHPDYYWSHFDNKKYMEAWDECIQSALEDKLKEMFKYELDMDVEYIPAGYWSPREYNFGHDVNNFILEAEDFSRLISYCQAHDKFEQFLKDNYTSYDGFLSCTANNLVEWREDIDNMEMTAYGAAITFLVQESLYDDLKNYAYEIFENLFYSEFVDYTQLDEFLAELDNNEDVELDEEWKKAIVERNK